MLIGASTITFNPANFHEQARLAKPIIDRLIAEGMPRKQAINLVLIQQAMGQILLFGLYIGGISWCFLM